jgi:predicted pyridoxine 5'-phosphate oxidase superfamily flavin-nucleotide-binding protein
MLMWPLFAGIGVAGVVLIGVVAFWVVQRDAVKAEPAPAAVQAAADEGGDIAVAAPEPRREIAASRFDLLATVADPDGYTNVRAAPSITGRILGRVLVGEAFATYDQRGDWWQVRLPGGTTGYISCSRIRLSGEPGADGSGSGAKRDRGGEVQAVDPSDMMFPDSSTRLLVSSELDQFGPSTLNRVEQQNVATIRAAEAHFQ